MHVKKIALGCGLVIFCGLIGFISWHLGSQAEMEVLTKGTPCIREVEPAYKFIKPLLVCDRLGDIQSAAYTPLRTTLEKLIADETAAGHISTAGIYFRDLTTGEWIAVNGDERFHPASLLKVPNMISILREADMGKNILTQTYTANDKTLPVPDQLIPPSHTIQNGVTYTVDELLKYMIAYSDNRANHALERFGDSDVLTSVFTDFHIPLGEQDAEFTISPHDYTLFFRALYNASYLSRGLSEKALNYLAQSDFTEGLVAGLPENTRVAHKFGNYSKEQPDGSAVQEIHDCGIIYTSSGDYDLCVMTRGKDIKELESVVSEVSRTVFNAFPHV